MTQIKKKRAPPVPKFQPTLQTKSQLLSKMGELYSKLNTTDEPEQPQTIPAIPQIPTNDFASVTPTTKPPQSEKKKLNILNLNEKLASMLSSKKDLLKPKQQPKKEPEVVAKQSTNQPGRKIDLDQEYDPSYPNKYEVVKEYYENLESRPIVIEKPEPQPMEIELAEEEVGLSQVQEKALRMMQKYGYKVGEGLGKNKQGITTPLTIKKTTESSCIIMPSSIPMNYVVPREVSVRTALESNNIALSPVIVLLNILTITELNEQHEQMIKQEMRKYGQVLDFMVYLLGRDLRIFIKYACTESSFRAFMELNQKYYEGSLVSIRFYNQTSFEAFKLDQPLHEHISC